MVVGAVTDAPAVRLWTGAQIGHVQGERNDYGGECMMTAAHHPNKGLPVNPVPALLDSGAFTDPPARRLTPQAALARQMAWESAASATWGTPWQAHAIVSYDLLIDETWIAGQREKRRWTVDAAEQAMGVTVDAAAYLASQREHLRPRILILSAQGADAIQYRECAEAILRVARPGDWFGLGGWCIIGRIKSMLPVFCQTMWEVLPLVAAAGLRHVHIFGVLWRPALGALLWIADRHDLTVSTDSTKPVMDCTWKGDRAKQAGVRVADWRGNVQWWVRELAMLRDSGFYRQPARQLPARQLSFSLAG